MGSSANYYARYYYARYGGKNFKYIRVAYLFSLCR